MTFKINPQELNSCDKYLCLRLPAALTMNSFKRVDLSSSVVFTIPSNGLSPLGNLLTF